MVLQVFNKFYNYFFLIVILFYNLVPKKARPFLLLSVSVAFFMFMSCELVFFLVLTILSIYLSAIVISKIEEKKKLALNNVSSEDKKQVKRKYQNRKKLVLLLCITFNVAFLFLFKYLNFFTINLNHILELFKFNHQFSVYKIIAPIGISFYTLQALSYLFDVYNGKITADKNIFKVALFMSYFPTIVEGPMARYSDTADDLYAGKSITYNSFCFGMQRILWGAFKKVVIADRINIVVNTIFDNYAIYSGPICLLGAISYTIMLYMEFSSTMDIVIGTSEVFGVKVPENFRQPFFSKTVSEFWTRWHISLGLWFKDYIYYPISLSKPMKRLTIHARKIVGNHFGPLISGSIALFVVWFLNGLWHGAGYTFLLFGMYHFMLIFLGNLFEPLYAKIFKKIGLNRDKGLYRVYRSIKVTFFVIIGELIFRAPTVKVAYTMLKKIFTSFSFKFNDILLLGLDFSDYIVLIFAIIIVLLISILKEKGRSIRTDVSKKHIILRWTLYYILIFSIIIFGAYGAGYQPVDPIYADF